MDTNTDISRANDLNITISVMTLAIVVTTSIRMVGKLFCRRALGPEDYLILLGTALDLVANAFDYKATASGFGRHTRFLSPPSRIQAVKYAQLAVGVAAWAIWSIKLSVCFFLLTLIRGTKHRYFRWATYALMVLTTISMLVGVALWATQARPLAKLWDPRIEGTTLSPHRFLVVTYVFYGLGCFTNIFYALSPAYFLWNVQLEWRKKAPVLAIMGCGIIVTIVGFLNIAFARDFLDRADSTWALTNEFICDIIERNISAFVANLPALWQLGRRFREWSSRTKTGEHPTGIDSSRPGRFEFGRNGYNSRLDSEDRNTHPLRESPRGGAGGDRW